MDAEPDYLDRGFIKVKALPCGGITKSSPSGIRCLRRGKTVGAFSQTGLKRGSYVGGRSATDRAVCLVGNDVRRDVLEIARPAGGGVLVVCWRGCRRVIQDMAGRCKEIGLRLRRPTGGKTVSTMEMGSGIGDVSRIASWPRAMW